MDESWWLFFFVGLFAQLVDGALGMAFGVTATSVMLSFGTAPARNSIPNWCACLRTRSKTN